MLLALLLALQLPPPFDAEARTPAALAAPAGAPVDQEADDDQGADDEDDGAADDAEAEGGSAAPGADLGKRYSSDLGDAELRRRWLSELPALGSISVGVADEGRVINAVQMGEDPSWTRVRPDLAWGTKETVEGLAAAFRAVHTQFPDSAPARLNHIGAQDGGFLRPHRSHQSGRDADLGFFYRNDVIPFGRARREKLIDPARTWALVRALVTLTDVQVILVDRGIQKVLREQALATGENPDWVDLVFRKGKNALVQHARRHRDHLHVRFFAPRSQELGRRIQPLLAERPEQNLAVHRVKSGQTLGHIAKKYGITVSALMKTNRLRKTFLRVGQQIKVPLKKPCTRCPLPPPLVVPPRCLPPANDRG